MSEFPEISVAAESELPAHNVSADVGIASETSSSSSSSFVPVEPIQDAIQVIDENKKFHQDILEYIRSTSRQGDHRIISVFGSQSTGKSTLLNHLFNTNFDVMDEGNRLQTTKGIWLALSPAVSNLVPKGTKTNQDNIVVLDVEGTDGRERGEDQDFERKAALFALSTSEVLIVNLWEHQVGLYQGANMGLLKTVFEVNLSLFGKAKLHNNDHKVLLLFVIRDHLGVTLLDSLSTTITQDLLKIWDNLNKPADVAHLAFGDFFDLAFHTLSHKVLQADKFLEDVRLLGNRFVDPANKGFLFKPFYHHDIPIDGWTMYAANCWEQIDNNKDLDLPTQQILVAKFKCDEISTQCYTEFLAAFSEFQAASTVDPDYKDIGLTFSDMKANTLENYDLVASKYNKSVYEQKRTALAGKINDRVGEVFAKYAKQLAAASLKTFTAGLSKARGGTFTETVASLTAAISTEYAATLALLSLQGELDMHPYVESLRADMTQAVGKQQVVELNRVVGRALKKLNNSLSTTFLDEIDHPSEETWDRILSQFQTLSRSVLSKYEEGEVPGSGSDSPVYDFGLGTTLAVNQSAADIFRFKSWQLLNDLVHKYISKDNLLAILKSRFEDKFRYDENGVPRLYQNTHDLEGSFGEAKAHALAAFPILTFAKLANSTEIVPPFDLHSKALKRKYLAVVDMAEVEDFEENDADSDSDSESEESVRCFAQIVSEKDKAEVMARFKKEIDATFVENKRAIMQLATHIPYYIYILLVVLGWSHVMRVLRNPLLFTLLLMVGAAVYVMYLLNLLGPASLVVQRLVDEGIALGKEKLRDFLETGHEQHGHNLARMARLTEKASIELDDLTPESE